MKKILVGTDTSASADLAVHAAADLARATSAELLVLHVRPQERAIDVADPKKSAEPERYLGSIAARFPDVRVRSWSEVGEPAERLCDVAAKERVETIVLGNKDVHGSRWRVRESVPNIVLRHAPCSVFIVDTRAAQ